MNKTKYAWLQLIIIFCSAFYLWNSTINSVIAEPSSNLTDVNLLKEQSKPNETTLPIEVQTAVLEAASQQTSRTVASLRILDSQPQEWSDGCLGLTEPGKLCVQQVISGWQVEVTDGLRNWTFRTDSSGDIVKLDEGVDSD